MLVITRGYTVFSGDHPSAGSTVWAVPPLKKYTSPGRSRTIFAAWHQLRWGFWGLGISTGWDQKWMRTGGSLQDPPIWYYPLGISMRSDGGFRRNWLPPVLIHFWDFFHGNQTWIFFPHDSGKLPASDSAWRRACSLAVESGGPRVRRTLWEWPR